MAAVEKIRVDTGRLNRDIEIFSNLYQALVDRGQEMHRSMDALNATWEGLAKETLEAQFRADYQYLDQIESILKDLIDDLQNARNAYDRCESDVSGIIDSIRIS